MSGKILIVGTGALGHLILQELAYEPNIRKIIAADSNPKGEDVVNYVIYTASLHGCYPNLEFIKIDLHNVKETAEILKEIKPNVICNATTLMSWWVYHLLPENKVSRLTEAGLGPQLPFHLTLTYKLMQAVKQAGIDTYVINCSYNDCVSPVLSKVGLAPLCGGGNAGLYIPRIKQFVSKEIGVPMRDITIYLYAHHGLASSLFTAPYLIKIYAYDRDITQQFPKSKIKEFMQPFVKERMGAWRAVPLNQHVAAAFAKIIRAIYGDTKEVCFVTGPHGLPGGYMGRLSYEKGVEIILPNGITLEDAVKANEECGRVGDGIEQIKDDGTVVFTEKAVKIYREELGYECEELKIKESEERAKELKMLIEKQLGETAKKLL